MISPDRPPAPGEALEWLMSYVPYRSEEDRAFIREGFRAIEGTPAVPPARPKEATRVATVSAELVRTGAAWRARFEGRDAIFLDLKGMRDIARLLQHPGTDVHCLDLAERGPESYGGEAAMDARARQSVKVRIRSLQEDLAEAEESNDIGRAETVRRELDGLLDAMSKAFGLGGRPRRMGDLTERARTQVTWRIRHAVKRIEAAHPALGRHLRHSLKTGTFCSYAPERTIAWEFRAAS